MPKKLKSNGYPLGDVRNEKQSANLGNQKLNAVVKTSNNYFTQNSIKAK